MRDGICYQLFERVEFGGINMETIRLIIDSIAGIIVPVVISIVIPTFITRKNRKDTEKLVNYRLDRLEKQFKEHLQGNPGEDQVLIDKKLKEIFSKPSNDEEDEIRKIERKISGWFSNKKQINSRILYAFINLYEQNNGTVTYEQLKEEANISTFEENFDQMKNISKKNHGKIFEQNGQNIYLWKEVEDIIWNYYKQNIKMANAI
jgi:hypothetical protein